MLLRNLTQYLLPLLIATLTLDVQAETEIGLTATAKFEAILKEYRNNTGNYYDIESRLIALRTEIDPSNVALKGRINSLLMQSKAYRGNLTYAMDVYETYETVGLSAIPVSARLRMMMTMLTVYWRMEEMEKLYRLQDALSYELKNAENVSTLMRAGSMVSLAQNYLMTKNYVKGLELLYLGRKILVISEEIPAGIREKLLGNVQREQISLMQDLGSFDVAKQFAEQVLEDVKSRPLIEQERANYFWAYQLINSGKYEEANKYFGEAVSMALKDGDKDRAADSMNLMAVSLFFAGNYEEALSTLNTFVNHFKEDQPRMIYSMHRILFESLHAALGTSETDIPKFPEIFIDSGRQDVAWALAREDVFMLKLNADLQERKGDVLDNVEAQAGLYKYYINTYQSKLNGTSYKKFISDEAAISHLTSQKLQERVDLQNQLLAEKNKQINYVIGLSSTGIIVAGLVFFLVFREKRTKRLYRDMAMRDPLTSSPNRRAITSYAQESMRASRSGSPTHVGIALIDLDHFKSVNDQYGHDVGDIVLKQFYEICSPLLRKEDRLGRYGGEEFLLVLPDASNDDIDMIFTRLQKALKDAKIEANGETLPITITMSMGAVLHQNDTDNVTDQRFEKLVKVADERVYKAKAGGRDQLVMV